VGIRLADAPHRLEWDDVRVSTVPVEAALTQGCEAVATGGWAAARDAFAELLDRSETPEALDGLGRALRWLGDERGAIVKIASASRSRCRVGSPAASSGATPDRMTRPTKGSSKSAASGSPIVVGIQAMPYNMLTTALDALYPAGLH
jgi:hypothetical protein